jgi:site-specific DNA recombinase
MIPSSGLLRCAIYARYSSDLQSPASISDQVRKCREYAAQQGWKVLPDHVYTDAEVSGAGVDRPGLQRLLAVIPQRPRQFDVLLIDDTSRLARRQADQTNIADQLRFAGFRFVAVSQGIDSASDQADVLMTVHGLVDSLYIKELAKKTHRGLEGRALDGFHTGGRCFGYRNEATPEGVRLAVDPTEAAMVVRIFEFSASGMALKSIAKSLNADGVPPPRLRKGKVRATWCPTAIRAILHNSIYSGKLIWNRSQFVKRPGTNKRVARPRPSTQWITVERPELRIVSEELWQRVQQRLQLVKEIYGRAGAGLHKASSSEYLLTGLLKCDLCGANLIIVAGKGRKTKRKYYGCSQRFNRGACSNSLTIRQDVLERNFFAGLQRTVLTDEVVAYTSGEVFRRIRDRQALVSNQGAKMRDRKRDVEQELRRLAEAIAATGHNPTILQLIEERQRELDQLTQEISPASGAGVELHPGGIREFVKRGLSDLLELLNADTSRARAELLKHTREIRMTPEKDDNGRLYYVASGGWDLMGGALLWNGCGGLQCPERSQSYHFIWTCCNRLITHNFRTQSATPERGAKPISTTHQTRKTRRE